MWLALFCSLLYFTKNKILVVKLDFSFLLYSDETTSVLGYCGWSPGYWYVVARCSKWLLGIAMQFMGRSGWLLTALSQNPHTSLCDILMYKHCIFKITVFYFNLILWWKSWIFCIIVYSLQCHMILKKSF